MSVIVHTPDFLSHGYRLKNFFGRSQFEATQVAVTRFVLLMEVKIG